MHYLPQIFQLEWEELCFEFKLWVHIIYYLSASGISILVVIFN